MKPHSTHGTIGTRSCTSISPQIISGLEESWQKTRSAILHYYERLFENYLVDNQIYPYGAVLATLRSLSNPSGKPIQNIAMDVTC
jgi:hypothetical protein